VWMSAQARPRLAVEAIEIRYNFFQEQELSNYLKFTAAGAVVNCSGTQKCLKYMQTGLKMPWKVHCGNPKMSELQLRIVAPRVGEFREATRIQQSFVTKAEKKALRWLAERVPPAINSDHLTVLGAAGMFLASASYALTRFNRYGLLLACFFLAVNWFGDSLDGTLARYRNRQRPRYGFYVDHVIDCFGVTALLAGMGASGHMNPLIAVWMLVAYLLLSSEIFLATYALARFEMSYFYFGPTELRILLCIGNLYVFFHPFVHPFGLPLSLWDLGAVVGSLGMTVIAVGSFVRHGYALYELEQLQ